MYIYIYIYWCKIISLNSSMTGKQSASFRTSFSTAETDISLFHFIEITARFESGNDLYHSATSHHLSQELLGSVVYIENDVYTRVKNCFSAHERVVLGFFPGLRNSEGNKHQNNTRVSAETVRHESTHIILFLSRHDESINDDKNDDLYTSAPCLIRAVFVLLMTPQSIADSATIATQLWGDYVNSDI